MENLDFLNDFHYSAWTKSLKELCPNYQAELKTSTVKVYLTLPFAWHSKKELEQEILEYCKKKLDNKDLGINLTLNFDISARKANGTNAAVKGVKNVIAISSAKGGVGKSTITVNLAFALKQMGLRVGILDADIYGPSIPHMLGSEDEKPTSPDNKTMSPVECHGIYCNSIGFLVPETDPTIWRGPVASTMLKQLMSETNWPDLDYLLIDMPPGTGDIQITAAQNLSLTGALVVSTPQEVALLDVIKGINMFNDVEIPVLGLVENMNLFHCPHCGQDSKLYSYDGVSEIAKVLKLPLFGSLPLDPHISKNLDDGKATTSIEPYGEIAERFYKIAQSMAYHLYISTKSAAPTINIKSL